MNTTPSSSAVAAAAAFQHPYFDIAVTGQRCSVCYAPSDVAHCCPRCAFPRCAKPACAAAAEEYHATACSLLALDTAPQLLAELLAPLTPVAAAVDALLLVPNDVSIQTRFLANLMRGLATIEVPRVLMESAASRQRAVAVFNEWRAAGFAAAFNTPAMQAVFHGNALPSLLTPGRAVADYAFLALFCLFFDNHESLTQLVVTYYAFVSVSAGAAALTSATFLVLERCPQTAAEAYQIKLLGGLSLAEYWRSDVEAAPAANVLYLIDLKHLARSEKKQQPQRQASHTMLVRLMRAPHAEPAAFVAQAHNGSYTLGEWLAAPPPAARFSGHVAGTKGIAELARTIDELTAKTTEPARRAALYLDLTGVAWPTSMTLSNFRATVLRVNLVV